MTRSEWLIRLVVVPVFLILGVLVLIKLGDNSELLTCFHTTTDGLCVVNAVSAK